MEEEGENSYLLVLGTGALEKRVQALAEKSCRVRAVGQVGETALYYRAADVFLLPSRYEGTSLSLLEAMACGLAVVATDTGDTARVVGEGEAGLLVPPEDVTALGEAMLRLGREEDLRCRLGQAAREKVEKEYSLRVMMERYEKLILRLLGERRSYRTSR